MFRLDYEKNARLNNDSIIKQIGQSIRSNIRSLDFSCRWNVSSFMILLPETKQDAAEWVANKIIEKIIQETNHSDSALEKILKIVVIQQQFSTFQELIEKMTKPS